MWLTSIRKIFFPQALRDNSTKDFPWKCSRCVPLKSCLMYYRCSGGHGMGDTFYGCARLAREEYLVTACLILPPMSVTKILLNGSSGGTVRLYAILSLLWVGSCFS